MIVLNQREDYVWNSMKKEGYEDRITVLQNTLPIDPANYTPVLEADKEELKVALLRRLINLLKR